MSSFKKKISEFMNERLYSLQENSAIGKNAGDLANLRRGIGRVPGDMPELWGIVFSGLPECLMSRNGDPTEAEWAIYTSLTLYALHQQGREANMHQSKIGIGTAVAHLISSDEDRIRVARRFNAFATSAEMPELSHHLRGLIQLLKTIDQPLDYVGLACDLYDYQRGEEQRNRVRLKWGQDFYRYKTDNESNNSDELEG